MVGMPLAGIHLNLAKLTRTSEKELGGTINCQALTGARIEHLVYLQNSLYPKSLTARKQRVIGIKILVYINITGLHKCLYPDKPTLC